MTVPHVICLQEVTPFFLGVLREAPWVHAPGHGPNERKSFSCRQLSFINGVIHTKLY